MQWICCRMIKAPSERCPLWLGFGAPPKAYASASRARELREEPSAAATSVTDAIYGAGFNSSSRFYETWDSLLGMRARDYRAGGRNAQIRSRDRNGSKAEIAGPYEQSSNTPRIGN